MSTSWSFFFCTPSERVRLELERVVASSIPTGGPLPSQTRHTHHIVCLVAGFLSAVIVALGFVNSLVLVERKIQIFVQLSPTGNEIQLADLSHDFGLWQILRACGEGDFIGGGKFLRVLLSGLSLVLVLVGVCIGVQTKGGNVDVM